MMFSATDLAQNGPQPGALSGSSVCQSELEAESGHSHNLSRQQQVSSCAPSEAADPSKAFYLAGIKNMSKFLVEATGIVIRPTTPDHSLPQIFCQFMGLVRGVEDLVRSTHLRMACHLSRGEVIGAAVNGVDSLRSLYLQGPQPFKPQPRTRTTKKNKQAHTTGNRKKQQQRARRQAHLRSNQGQQATPAPLSSQGEPSALTPVPITPKEEAAPLTSLAPLIPAQQEASTCPFEGPSEQPEASSCPASPLQAASPTQQAQPQQTCSAQHLQHQSSGSEPQQCSDNHLQHQGNGEPHYMYVLEEGQAYSHLWGCYPDGSGYAPVYTCSPTGSFQVPMFQQDSEQGWYLSGCLTGAFVIARYRFDPVTGYSHSLQVSDSFPKDLPTLGPYDAVKIQGPVDAQAALDLYSTIPGVAAAVEACEAALPPVDCNAPPAAAAAALISEGPLCPPAPDTPLASEAGPSPLALEVPLTAEPCLSAKASLAPAAPQAAAVEPSAPLAPQASLVPLPTVALQQRATKHRMQRCTTKRHQLPPRAPQQANKAQQLAPITPRVSDAASACPLPVAPQQAPQHSMPCAPVSQPGMVEPAAAAAAAAADLALPWAPPPIRTSLVSVQKGPRSLQDIEQCMEISSSSSCNHISRAVSLSEVEASMGGDSRRSSDSSSPSAPSTPRAPGSTSGCAAANFSPFAGAAACVISGTCNAKDLEGRGSALLARLRSQASGGCVGAAAHTASGACDLVHQSSTLLAMLHSHKSGGCAAASSRKTCDNSGSVSPAALPIQQSGGCVAVDSIQPHDANARASLALLTAMQRPKSSVVSQHAAVGVSNATLNSCEGATGALRAMLLRC